MRDEFERLLQDESHRLYRLSFRLTGNPEEAEDLCQEALARAYKNLDRFKGQSQISTWLFRIIVNAWKNKIRKKRRVTILGFFHSEESTDGPIEFNLESLEPSPEKEMEKKESGKILQQALLGLDAEDREIVVLRDLEEKSYEELSGLLGIPLGTVKSRLARARESLRVKLAPILKSNGELV